MMDPSLLLFFGEGATGGAVGGGSGGAGAAADHYLDFLSQLRYGGAVAQPSVLVVDDGDSDSGAEDDGPRAEDDGDSILGAGDTRGGDDGPHGDAGDARGGAEDPNIQAAYILASMEDKEGPISNFFEGGDISADREVSAGGEGSIHDCGCGDIDYEAEEAAVAEAVADAALGVIGGVSGGDSGGVSGGDSGGDSGGVSEGELSSFFED